MIYKNKHTTTNVLIIYRVFLSIGQKYLYIQQLYQLLLPFLVIFALANAFFCKTICVKTGMSKYQFEFISLYSQM